MSQKVNMYNNKLTNVIRLAIILGISSTASISSFSVAAAQDISQEKESIEKITVTARHKSESIIEIPMAISTISALEIEDRNYINAEDIYRTLAGAAIPRGQLILRGLSGGNTSTPHTTTTFVDDVPYTSKNLNTEDIFTDLFDIERVEVLRGPQGTLYGSNAIGGTVRIITNKPVLDEFELFGSAQVGSEKNVDGYDSKVSLGINIPLIENTLALRVNGSLSHDELPYENMNTGLQADTEQSFIRSQLRWQVAKELSITFGYSNISYSDKGENQGDLSTPEYYDDYALIENPEATYGYDVDLFEVFCAAGASRPECLGGSAANNFSNVSRKYQTWNLLDRHYKSDTDVFTLNIQSTDFFGIASLTYAGSFRQFDSKSLDDWSRADASDMFKTWIVNDDFHEQTSHELRLQNIDVNSPLIWTLGLFYNKSETIDALDTQNQYHESGDAVSALALEWWWDDATQIGIDTFNNPQQNWNYAILEDIEKEFSIFADVAYIFNLKDAGELELSAGVRRFDFSDRYHEETAGIWSEGEVKNSGKEQGNRYKFSASYRPTDDLSVYALYSEGYRPGGNNEPLPQSCDDDPKASERKDRYESDAIKNYELGLKASTFNNSVNFAFAVYHIDWSDIKTDIYMNTCDFFYTANAGKAASKGFEFESSLQLSEDLTVTLNTSYTNSKLTEDNEAISGKKGDQMTMIPNWNGYLAFDQGFTVFGKQAFVRADYSYYGSYKTHFDVRPEDEVPSYSLVNVSSRIEISDSVTLSVHLNNLFDKEAYKYRRAVARAEDYDEAVAQEIVEFINERNLTLRVDYTFF